MNTPEQLGPAETIIKAMVDHVDHLYHGRPGVVTTDRSPVGATWKPAKRVPTDQLNIVYSIEKVGHKEQRTRLGILRDDSKIYDQPTGGAAIGRYHRSGLFKEVVVYCYQRIADVWKMDNEFAARWASFAFGQDYQDMKVILAAFMIVQSRKGDPIRIGDEVILDDDYRNVGEAMMLIRSEGKDLNAKHLLRIREILAMPEIAEINRQLGFGISRREPPLGRWNRIVQKWLRYREENFRVLEGLVKSGQTAAVRQLIRLSGYKPTNPKVFEILRWSQTQATQGHRTVRIGEDIAARVSWEGLSEKEVCERISKEKLSWKVVSTLIPKTVGITPAVVAASIENGGFSPKDLIIATPTLEDLGLLKIPAIRARWEAATKAATDMRAANVAKNVRNKTTQEVLNKAAETASAKAVEEQMKNLFLYIIIDISDSMRTSITLAKEIIGKLAPAFPIDQMNVVVFNTVEREVKLEASKGTKNASAATIEKAFRGISASGGTSYAAAFRNIHKPLPDHDTLCIFIGDEEDHNAFEDAVRASGINPSAFGLVRIGNTTPQHLSRYNCVRRTAAALRIPCFSIDPNIINDPYAVPRTLRNLIASTPVGVAAPTAAPKTPRKTLIRQIMETKLLEKPAWA